MDLMKAHALMQMMSRRPAAEQSEVLLPEFSGETMEGKTNVLGEVRPANPGAVLR